MGEKGNLPAEAAAASLGERAVSTGQTLTGVAVTKAVEVTVEGAIEGARQADEGTTETPTDPAGT